MGGLSTPNQNEEKCLGRVSTWKGPDVMSRRDGSLWRANTLPCHQGRMPLIYRPAHKHTHTHTIKTQHPGRANSPILSPNYEALGWGNMTGWKQGTRTLCSNLKTLVLHSSASSFSQVLSLWQVWPLFFCSKAN